MKKEFTKKDYDQYMIVVNNVIKEIEIGINNLDRHKKVSQLSFEDWTKFQNGEIKLSDLEIKPEVKDSLKILYSVDSHRSILDKYARSKYYEIFINERKKFDYHNYLKYDIISDSKIRVNYVYGYGEMDFSDSFIIEI